MILLEGITIKSNHIFSHPSFCSKPAMPTAALPIASSAAVRLAAACGRQHGAHRVHCTDPALTPVRCPRVTSRGPSSGAPVLASPQQRSVSASGAGQSRLPADKGILRKTLQLKLKALPIPYVWLKPANHTLPAQR